MIRWLATALDRVVIKCAALSLRGGPAPVGRQEEATRLLTHPDFFCDFAIAPAELTFTNEQDFQFASRIETPWAVNNIVHGRLLRCGPDWQRQPVFILLHGWNSELMYDHLFPAWARRLNRIGVSALIFELPYHGARRPTEPGAVNDFISGDLLRVFEATRQAVADTRTLITWARARGCPEVGLWGVSLGGWLAGLTACADERLSSLVLMEPAARMDRLLTELEFTAPVRQGLAQTPLDLGRLNLASLQPRLPADRILVATGRHDVFTPIETERELCEKWGGPELLVFDHGHISLLLVRRPVTRIVEWIADRTEPAKVVKP